MKKLIIGATALLISLSSTLSVQAGNDHGVNGLLIGAGGGAIAGQAIGRNTEATLIGTAVGGLLGYVIGNEMDKGSQRHYVSYPSSRTIVQRQTTVTYVPAPPPVRYRPEPVGRPFVEYRRAPECREAEILGTVNGHPKKIYGTVCRNGNGWELVSEQNDPTPVGWRNHGHYPRRFDRRF